MVLPWVLSFSHFGASVVDHFPDEAFTVTVLLPPTAGNYSDAGDTVNVGLGLGAGVGVGGVITPCATTEEHTKPTNNNKKTICFI